MVPRQIMVAARVYDPRQRCVTKIAWKVAARLGLRREANRHAAFERPDVFAGSLVCRPCKSAVVAALCRRSPGCWRGCRWPREREASENAAALRRFRLLAVLTHQRTALSVRKSARWLAQSKALARNLAGSRNHAAFWRAGAPRANRKCSLKTRPKQSL